MESCKSIEEKYKTFILEKKHPSYLENLQTNFKPFGI